MRSWRKRVCYRYNLSLIALITCDVEDDVFPQAQIVVGGRTLVPGAWMLGGVVGNGSPEGV